MKIAATVVLYDPDDDVLENIDSYINYVDRLYAVDNSAENHAYKFNSEKITYIHNGKNEGIAFALNVGAHRAIDDGYEWLLTMDQDSRFSGDTVAKMKDFILDCKNNPDSQYQYDKIGLVTPLHRTKLDISEYGNGIDSPAVVMTSGNIISLKAYDIVGGFKDWMFIDAVDFDYCLNLRDHGFDIWRLLYLELHHNLGDVVIKNIGNKQWLSSNHSPLRRYYIVRNRYYFYDMYHERHPDFCNAEKKMTVIEAKRIIVCEKHKFKKLFAMLRGYIDYKRGVKGFIF